jgi:hypothetical protein
MQKLLIADILALVSLRQWPIMFFSILSNACLILTCLVIIPGNNIG